eukprot:g27490.t1
MDPRGKAGRPKAKRLTSAASDGSLPSAPSLGALCKWWFTFSGALTTKPRRVVVSQSRGAPRAILKPQRPEERARLIPNSLVLRTNLGVKVQKKVVEPRGEEQIASEREPDTKEVKDKKKKKDKKNKKENKAKKEKEDKREEIGREVAETGVAAEGSEPGARDISPLKRKAQKDKGEEAQKKEEKDQWALCLGFCTVDKDQTKASFPFQVRATKSEKKDKTVKTDKERKKTRQTPLEDSKKAKSKKLKKSEETQVREGKKGLAGLAGLNMRLWICRSRLVVRCLLGVVALSISRLQLREQAIVAMVAMRESTKRCRRPLRPHVKLEIAGGAKSEASHDPDAEG